MSADFLDDDWLPEAEYARLIGKTVRTLRIWRAKRTGPPFAYFGRTPMYRRSSRAEYLKANEVNPLRPQRRVEAASQQS